MEDTEPRKGWHVTQEAPGQSWEPAQGHHGTGTLSLLTPRFCTCTSLRVRIPFILPPGQLASIQSEPAWYGEGGALSCSSPKACQ